MIKKPMPLSYEDELLLNVLRYIIDDRLVSGKSQAILASFVASMETGKSQIVETSQIVKRMEPIKETLLRMVDAYESLIADEKVNAAWFEREGYTTEAANIRRLISESEGKICGK